MVVEPSGREEAPLPPQGRQDGPDSSSPRRRLLAEGLWAAFGQLVSAAALLVGVRILTELVPPAVFGTVSLLVGLIAVGTNIFCGPQFQAALRFYPDLAAKGQVGGLRRTIGHDLRWTAGALAALFLIGGVVAIPSLGSSAWAAVALAVLLLAEVFRTFETALLTAARRQRGYALWHATENVFRPLFAALAVLWLGATPQAILAGYAAATAGVYWVCRLTVAPEGLRGREGENPPDRGLGSEVRRYALPLVPLGLVAWVSALSDRYIIGGILGLEAVGIYAAAYGLVSRPFLLAGTALELTLRPVYYRAVSAGDPAQGRRVLNAWIGVTAVVCALGALLVMLLKDVIAALLLAPSYRTGATLMPWIALGYALLVTSLVLEKPCYAHKRTGWVTITQASGAVASVAVGVPLVYALGLAGAAMAVPIYFGCQCLVAVLVKRLVENSR